MAIYFKTKPATGPTPDSKSLTVLQDQVRTALGLSDIAHVQVGFSRTTVSANGIQFSLPFGIPEVKKGPEALQGTHQSLIKLFSAPTPLPEYDAASEAAGGVPIPNKSKPAPATVDYDDMEDQDWAVHVADELFPGVLSLHNATELYQPVTGTSAGSIYKTCFIGPDLRVASRIRFGKVSFRATTPYNKRPTGNVAKVFERLGVTNEQEDRLTCHAVMQGPYDDEHAHEYRALFGAFYAALQPWITSKFPAIGKLATGVK